MNNKLKIPKTRQKAIKKRFIETVEDRARERRKAQENFDEIDFFCGAMSALEALFGEENWATLARPWWIWGPIAGRGILDEVANDKKRV